jgi:hypothetical protein
LTKRSDTGTVEAAFPESKCGEPDLEEFIDRGPIGKWNDCYTNFGLLYVPEPVMCVKNIFLRNSVAATGLT